MLVTQSLTVKDCC